MIKNYFALRKRAAASKSDGGTSNEGGSGRKPFRMNAKVRKYIFVAVMLAFPLAHLFVFWFLVNINTVVMAFEKFSWDTGTYVFTGFDNFKRVFEELANSPTTRRAVVNSLLYFPVTNFISLPLSLIFSYFLYKKVPCSKVYRVLFFLPSILPIAVLTMAFSFTFDSSFGPVNAILKAMGIMPPSWFGVYPNNQIMIFLYCIWAGLGTNIVLFSGAIGRIPLEIMEYSKLEGVGKTREFFQIVIPLVWPTITTTFILGCTSVYTVMLQPLMLTPSSPDTLTIALMIYNGVLAGRNMPYLAAFGFTMSLLGVPVIMLIKWGLGKVSADVDY